MFKRMLFLCVVLDALFVTKGAIVPEANYTTFDREPLLDYLTDARQTMSLDGDWQMTRQKERAIDYRNVHGETRVRYEPLPFDPSTSKWQKVVLPQATDPFTGNIIHLKRTFELTPALAAGSIILKTEMVGGSYRLSVNGKEVAYEPQPFGLKMSHDLTSVVKPGANEIYFRLYKGNGTRVWEDKLDGALREDGFAYPMYLEFGGKVTIEDVKIVTQVEPEKNWTAHVSVTNRTDETASIEVSAVIEGEDVKRPRCSVTVPAKGSSVVTLSFPWKEALLWSPANPHLYWARLELLPSDASGASVTPLDAVRQRFGFREISIRGPALRLNGHPFMMRRQTEGSGDLSTLGKLKRLRQNGYVGLRVFLPTRVERMCRLADEFGFLITPCVGVGCVAHARTDKFWSLYEKVLREMVGSLGNHPSIICWGISNEFGYVYGGGKGEKAEATIKKQQGAGRLVETLDPTRPWTACGEAEMGWPFGAPGPMPIVSMHYPFSPSGDGVRFPSAGYWYADGGGGWQGMTRRDKPTCVSEDLYHGLIDAYYPLAKIGGDAIFTADGYAAALHGAVRSFAEGYYAGGLAGWEPWCVWLTQERNRLPLKGRGPLHPDYLISVRGFYPNLFAGKAESRTLTVYNQWFAVVKGTLSCEVVLHDMAPSSTNRKIASWKENVTIDPGRRFEKTVEIPAPMVTRPTRLTMTYRLTADGKELAVRSDEYTIFPKVDLAVPKGAALMATKDSPLRKWTFPKGVYTRAAEAIRSGATCIVVDAPLMMQDGQRLDDFVNRGGHVLLARSRPGGWNPARLEEGKLAAKIFRRAEGHMTGLIEDALRVWRPDPADDSKGKETDETVCRNAYLKPDEDSLVLYDVAMRGGMTHAAVLWLYRGRGGWLLNATDAVRKLDHEPAAESFVQALLDELAAAQPNRLGKTLVADDPSAALPAFLVEKGFAMEAWTESLGGDRALFVDAQGQPLDAGQLSRIRKICADGGCAAIFNMTQEVNVAVLDLLKIDWTAWKTQKVEVPWGKRGNFVKTDDGPKFVTRRGNDGMMAGIPNDWLFWGEDSFLVSWSAWKALGSPYAPGMFKDVTMVMNGILAPRKDFNGVILTDVPALAFVRVGKGMVLVSTLKMNENLGKAGDKITKLIRALLNNMGVRTSRRRAKIDWLTVDFAAQMTHALWPNPEYKNEKGQVEPTPIFAGMSDLRYFPVNNCGWSLQAGNYCPVEEFPDVPLNFQDVPFRLQDPAKNNRRAALQINAGSGVVRIPLPPRTYVKKVHFLGAHQWGLHELHCSFGTMGNGKAVVFNGKDHIGDFCWGPATTLTTGKIAWDGRGGEKGRNRATLYTWSAENPDPTTPVPFLELKTPPPPKGSNTSVGLLAITIERVGVK